MRAEQETLGSDLGVGALAGALGAASSLVVIEVLTLFDATGLSVTEAVQNRFIDTFAASLKQVAIDLFGTNDKAALQVGTALVVLAIGAVLGAAARGRVAVLAAGFGGFAALGIFCAWSDPLASRPVSLVSAVIGAVVGLAMTVVLHRSWSGAPLLVTGRAATAVGAPLPRRVVLARGGVTALVLMIGTIFARALRASLRQGASVVTQTLPPAAEPAVVPRQPFAPEGISPYVTPTADFYRIDTALRVPVVDVDSWDLTITGMVDRELRLTYDDLLACDQVEALITIQCVSNEVGGDLIGTARWTGVPLAALLEQAGVASGVDQIMGESVDGFTAGFPLEAGIDGRDTLVALGMNGRTLDATHGFPVRLIVPGLYGYVSATKWLREIRLTTFDAEQGFWVPRGWAAEGPIKVQSRIDVPDPSNRIDSGTQAIAGVAWAPHTGIDAVEVRIDGGDWQPANLGKVASVDTWVQWWLEWEATPGSHQIAVRATDAEGTVQTDEFAPPAPDGATGHHTITAEVF